MESHNETERKVYYSVEESFFQKVDDGVECVVSKKILFKKGALIERRLDALEYCSNREKDLKLLSSNNLKGNEKPSNVNDNYYSQNPLPENLIDFEKIEISCSLVIEVNGEIQESLLFLHSNSEMLSFSDVADECDLLLTEMLVETGHISPL